MSKRNSKLARVDIGFEEWLRKESPYKGKKMPVATRQLKDDLVNGRFTRAELKNTLSRIEEMLYGKGKKKGLF